MKNTKKIGTLNQSKKNISNPMIRAIKKYQKYLQLQENIRFGRKAKTISFVYTTKDVKGFAKFIMEGKK